MNIYLFSESDTDIEIALNKYNIVYTKSDFQNITSKTKIDILIVVGMEKSVISLIKNIRSFNKTVFIVHIYEQIINITSVLEAGANDTMHKNTLLDSVLLSRLKTWMEIAEFRKLPINSWHRGKNAFGVNVFGRRTRFYIKDENSLELLWEHFSYDKRFDNVDWSEEWINCVMGICRQLIDLQPVIVFEEDSENFYLTISNINNNESEFYDNLITVSGLDKTKYLGFTYNKTKGIFSIYVKKSEKNKKFKIESKSNSSKFEQIIRESVACKRDCAKDYCDDCGIDNEDLVELEMLENELTELLFRSLTQKERLQNYSSFFTKYAKILNKLVEFKSLAIGLDEAARITYEISLTGYIDVVNNALVFANLIKQDISSWRIRVFVAKDAENIHYLDAALLANCIQFEHLLKDDNFYEGSGLELF